MRYSLTLGGEVPAVVAIDRTHHGAQVDLSNFDGDKDFAESQR